MMTLKEEPEEDQTEPDDPFLTLQLKIAELELALRRKEEELAAEKERCQRACRKVKQLLLKLGERDRTIAELKTAQAPGDQSPSFTPSRRRGRPDGFSQKGRPVSPSRDGTLQEDSSTKLGASRAQLAIERAQILTMLEGHMSQMRSLHAASEKEVEELQKKKQQREVELSDIFLDGPGMAEAISALSILKQQLQDKRRFTLEMGIKIKGVERELAKHRACLEQMRGVGPYESALPVCLEEETESPEEILVTTPQKPSNKALEVYLEHIGPSAEFILRRPALIASFEAYPPELTASVLDGFTVVQRAQVLSFFTAWATAAQETTRAMRLSDLRLQSEDLAALSGTLQTCPAHLEEVSVNRCPMGTELADQFFQSLVSQPLKRLSMGYSALGPEGAEAFVRSAHSAVWIETLIELSLEMTGIGDEGCKEVSAALGQGILPLLRQLELGWNELSADSAPGLAALLKPTGARKSPPCQIEKMGLGGNQLGSSGAAQLMSAALSIPSRILILDISMNRVGSKALEEVCQSLSQESEGFVNPDTQLAIILEWNEVEDVDTVKALAAALPETDESPSGRSPILRLTNNELGLDPTEAQELLRHRIAC